MTYDEDDDVVIHILEMIDLFKHINIFLQQDDGTDVEFCNHVLNQSIFNDDDKEHLPIPEFSYIDLTVKMSFILHYMLSEDQFETKTDLMLHENIRECFRYCKFIGPNKDKDSLIRYANKLNR